MNNINDRVKELRHYLGLDIAKFARKLDYSPAYYITFETGARKYSDKCIMRMCSRFGVREEWLRNGTGPMLKEERAAADPDGLRKRIRQIRKERKLTQGQLSEKVGIRRMYVSLIERGQGKPSREVTMKLAIALDVSYDWLMYGGDEKGNEIRQALKKRRIKEAVDYLRTNDKARELVEEIYKNKLWETILKVS